jgi:hypothetical protein
MAAAQHQGVAAEVELLDRQGQQGQVLLHVADPPGKTLDERGMDAAPGQPTLGPLALPIHKGKEIRS